MQPALKRLFGELITIYYCAAFFVYSTAFLVWFWELPSLLLRFSLADIIGFFSYQLVFALAESLIVAFFMMLLVHLFPMKHVKENRSVVGGLFIASFAISSLIFKFRTTMLNWLSGVAYLNDQDAQQILMFFWLFSALGFAFVSINLVKTEKFAQRLRSYLENLSILAYVYTALSIIGIVIVAYRNLA